MEHDNPQLEGLDSGTFPWTDFEQIFRSFQGKLSLASGNLLGQAQAKCDQIGSAEIPPDVRQRLRILYLSKGAQGSVQIEGSSLTVEEVQAIALGQMQLPLSKRNLQQEAENVLEALRSVSERATLGEQLTFERLCELHSTVYRSLPWSEDVMPGELRTSDVVVGRYKAPHARYCRPLLDNLCQWLAQELGGETQNAGAASSQQSTLAFSKTVMCAVFAHLFLAMIHPFGDGNGRLSRVIEVKILVEGGIPEMSAHLLSNHYNSTRSDYHGLMDEIALSPRFPAEKFFHYALQGFVDGLDEQLEEIRAEQTSIAWESYIHKLFTGNTSKPELRQRDIALALLDEKDPTDASALPRLTPSLQAAYAGKSQKTLTRDINALEETGILTRENGKISLNRQILRQ